MKKLWATVSVCTFNSALQVDSQGSFVLLQVLHPNLGDSRPSWSIWSTSIGSIKDRSPGSRPARKHWQWSIIWLGPAGCPGWQALCGQSPRFQGAKTKEGQEFLTLILPLIPPRNEACQSSNSLVFMRRLWWLLYVVFKEAIKWRNQTLFSFLIKWLGFVWQIPTSVARGRLCWAWLGHCTGSIHTKHPAPPFFPGFSSPEEAGRNPFIVQIMGLRHRVGNWPANIASLARSSARFCLPK